MNVAGPKERATFSLSPSLKSRLDEAIPKSERSRFVEQAIDEALRAEARTAARKFLDDLPRKQSKENSTEFLRRKRLEWDGRPIDLLEGRRDG